MRKIIIYFIFFCNSDVKENFKRVTFNDQAEFIEYSDDKFNNVKKIPVYFSNKKKDIKKIVDKDGVLQKIQKIHIFLCDLKNKKDLDQLLLLSYDFCHMHYLSLIELLKKTPQDEVFFLKEFEEMYEKCCVYYEVTKQLHEQNYKNNIIVEDESELTKDNLLEKLFKIDFLLSYLKEKDEKFLGKGLYLLCKRCDFECDLLKQLYEKGDSFEKLIDLFGRVYLKYCLIRQLCDASLLKEIDGKYMVKRLIKKMQNFFI